MSALTFYRSTTSREPPLQVTQAMPVLAKLTGTMFHGRVYNDFTNQNSQESHNSPNASLPKTPWPQCSNRRALKTRTSNPTCRTKQSSPSPSARALRPLSSLQAKRAPTSIETDLYMIHMLHRFSVNSNQRKFSKKKSVIRKVESQDPDALRTEVSTENREGYLCSACGSPRVRHGLATGAECCLLAQQRRRFRRFLGGLFCVAGAARWQPKVQISWRAQYFFAIERGRRIIFARSSANFVAGAALSQGQR